MDGEIEGIYSLREELRDANETVKKMDKGYAWRCKRREGCVNLRGERLKI